MFDLNHYMCRGGGAGGKEFIYRIISANKLCTRTVGEEGAGWQEMRVHAMFGHCVRMG